MTLNLAASRSTVQEKSVVKIAADRLQMEQVLLNLIRNAIESAAENPIWQKRVSIRLRRAGQRCPGRRRR